MREYCEIISLLNLQLFLSHLFFSNTITSGGYIWRRINAIETVEDLVKKLSRNIPALQGIEQYDTNGNLLTIFDNAGQASKETGINVSSIKAAGDGK